MTTTEFINRAASACNKRVEWHKPGRRFDSHKTPTINGLQPIVMKSTKDGWEDKNTMVQFEANVSDINAPYVDIVLLDSNRWFIAIMEGGKFYLQENLDNGEIVDHVWAAPRMTKIVNILSKLTMI